MKDVVDKFFEWKHDAGLTMRQAASLLNIDVSYLARIGTGQKDPSPRVVADMTKLVNRLVNKAMIRTT